MVMSEEIKNQTDLSTNEILHQVTWVVNMRWLAVGSVFASAALLRLFFPYRFLPVASIALFVLVYNFLAWYHYKYCSQNSSLCEEKDIQLNLQTQIILDILVIAWTIHLTGGVQSEVVPFYLVHIPFLGLAISRRTLFSHAGLIAVVLALLFGLEFYGILPHGDLGTTPDLDLYKDFQYIARRWTTITIFLLLGTYITNYLGTQFRHLLLAEQKALQQSESLKKVAVSLGSTLEWKETLNVILRSINELTFSDSAAIVFINDAGAKIIAGQGIPPHLINTTIPVAKWSHYKVLFKQNQSIITQPVNEADRFWKAVDVPKIKCSLYAPMILHNTALGILIIGSKTPNLYSKEDASLVQSLAHYAALSLENSQLYENARHQALTDGLTGLYNVRSLHNNLEQELTRSKRYGRKFSVLMCDLDKFKSYNDRYGHLAGDDLLRDLAALMTSVARRNDKIFRYGGEEFTILLPETRREHALVLAERLRKSVEEHEFILQDSGEISHITISIGLSVFPDDANAVKPLLKAADRALYKAKENRNKVFSYADC